MFYKVFWFASLLSTSTAVDSRFIDGPGNVPSLVTGAAALGQDPAAAAAREGAELHWYQALTFEERPRGEIGIHGVAPLGKLRLLGGVEWSTLGRGEGVRRETLGASLELGEAFYFGGAYRTLDALDDSFTGEGSWDLGVYGQPASWMAWSLGVDRIGGVVYDGKRESPIYRGGLGFKPAPWLRAGVDLRWGKAGARSSVGVRGVQAGVLLEPVAGLIFSSMVESDGERETLWLGASIESSGMALGGRAGSRAGVPVGAWEVSLRSQPYRSYFEPGGRAVVFTLEGDLITEENSWWDRKVSVSTVALQLEELASDPGVGVVYLRVGEVAVGLADIEAIRRGITKLRSAGKRVEAYVSTVKEKGYLLAAAADVVFLDPMGQITLDGFSVKKRFWADFLGKLGIRFEAVAVGAYKTGADFLTRTSSRPEEQETLEHLLDQAYATLREGLARDRNLSVPQIEAILLEGHFGASRAKELGLVDELTGAPGEVPRELPPALTFAENRRARPTWGRSKKVAVIPIAGTLVGGQRGGLLGGKTVLAETVVGALKEARERSDVIGVVLRVESPGGEVLAAEAVWREVRRFGAEKPVVVSMGAVAASGGYYLAAPANRIFVEANTITGSIGVFALRPDFSGVYEKTGIRNEVTVRGVHADAENLDHPLDEIGRKRLEKSLRLYYEAFVGKVAAGRQLELARAFELAEGRVYSGVEAVRVGLADEIGGLVEAVEAVVGLAAEREETVVVILDGAGGFDVGGALSGLGRGPETMGEAFGNWVESLSQWEQRVLALLPATYEVSP